MILRWKFFTQNVPCCVVRQDSLDIEQFSYKAAVIICKLQGYKFWFCNDYDIEIVDVSWNSKKKFLRNCVNSMYTRVLLFTQVCPINGDIMAVVFMRINAEPIKQSGAQDQG